MSVVIKTQDEIAGMRAAGRLAAEVLEMIECHVQPGVTTGELDRVCHDFIVDTQRAIPAPLDYRGFPRSICTSVNHQVCHGIPGNKQLKKGDIVNIDVTVIKDGFHGDTSKMFLLGEPSILARRLVQTTHRAMWIGIEQVRPGARLGDIGHAIQRFVESHRFSVVRDERFAVQVEEETDLGGRGRVVEEERILDHGIEIEELDRFQGSPYLLPSAAEVGTIQNVDQRALEAGDPHPETEAIHYVDPDVYPPAIT